MIWRYNLQHPILPKKLGMSIDLSEIEQQAVRLSDQERAQLAAFLLRSLESIDHGDIEEDWRIDAETRLAQVQRGEARLILGDEVFANIRRRQT